MINIEKTEKNKASEQIKELQKVLNSKGYSLQVDGILGDNTKTAVTDYITQNKAVSGEALGKATTTASIMSDGETAEYFSTVEGLKKSLLTWEMNTPTYTKSDELSDLENELSDWKNNAPADYSGKYDEKISEALEKILNREKFSYDLSDDPLYEQYRRLYSENGRKALLDTMANAAALSGGYGSSYAQTAGYNSYGEYLAKLGDIAMDLRDRAYEAYLNEGNVLSENLDILRGLDSDDYKKYLEDVERYYSDGDMLLEMISQMSDSEYEEFSQKFKTWETMGDYLYGKYEDAVTDEQEKAELQFKKDEAARDQANADRDYALEKEKVAISKSKASSSSSSSSSKKTSSSSSSTVPTTYEQFCSMTGYSGVMTEVEFRRNKSMREKYDTYKDYLKAMYKLYKDYDE